MAADDLPAVSTGPALSGLQQAASGLVASARQAVSGQPSTSHPGSRLVSQTVSAAASPTTSAARYTSSATLCDHNLEPLVASPLVILAVVLQP